MFLATTTEEWHRASELNFMSVIHFARAVLPWMQRQHWGRIVTITSVSVRQPVSDLIYSNAVRAESSVSSKAYPMSSEKTA